MAEDKETSTIEDVRAAYESLEADQAPPPVPPEAVETEVAAPKEPADQGGTRARNPDGTFAKSDEPKEPKRETLTLKEKPQGTSAPSDLGAPAPPVPPSPAAPEKVMAPQAWSGLAKVKWDRLPADVQREIAQHEQTREATVADLAPVKELIDVNREFLVNQAGSLPNAFSQLMQFARMSVDNPVQLAEHILRARGIDPRAAFAGQPQGTAPQQPQDIQAYVAQLVQQAVQPFQAQAEQQQTQQLQTTIDEFARRPDRPFFNDVRVHMGQLISAGTAKSLDEAYEQATWANKAIREHLLEEQRGAAEAAKAAEVQKAKAAQRASVTGSPLPGAVGLNGKSDPKATALDDVRAAYNELSGA